MKIAHVVARFPPDVGGMGEVVRAEADALVKLGYEVTVFALRSRDNALRNEHAPTPLSSAKGGSTSCRRGELRPLIPGGDAGWVPQLFFKLKNFDLVHLHYPFYGGAEFVWLAKLLRGQKYVVTYHMQAAPTRGYQKLVKWMYDTVFTKTILKNAEKVLVVDGSYFKDVETRFIASRSKVIELPNGIDTQLFCPPNNVEVQYPVPSQGELLFVGNLMPVKGLDLLLQALARPPARLASLLEAGGSPSVPLPAGEGNLGDVRLMVVGSGYEEAAYKKMVVDLKLENRVTFVGSVPHNELPKFYQKAWAAVVPSRAESFSLVALESMACGTPVIASDVIGVRGKIDAGVDGWLFESEKILDLRLKILDCVRVSGDERKKIGEMGSLKVKTKFSLEKHMSELLKSYLKVIK